jgi:hypothetical protein
MDDWHFNNITKVKNKTFVLNRIGENKNLQFLKKWTYIYVHDKNNIVKDLMKAFFISH